MKICWPIIDRMKIAAEGKQIISREHNYRPFSPKYGGQSCFYPRVKTDRIKIWGPTRHRCQTERVRSGTERYGYGTVRYGYGSGIARLSVGIAQRSFGYGSGSGRVRAEP